MHIQADHNGDKPITCDYCGLGFQTKQDLEMHIQADHNGDKPITCDYCGLGFQTKQELEMHYLKIKKKTCYETFY